MNRAILGLFACRIASGQATNPALSFEAASVKLSPAGPMAIMTMQGGPGTSDPGRIAYTFMNLRNVLARAYDVG